MSHSELPNSATSDDVESDESSFHGFPSRPNLLPRIIIETDQSYSSQTSNVTSDDEDSDEDYVPNTPTPRRHISKEVAQDDLTDLPKCKRTKIQRQNYFEQKHWSPFHPPHNFLSMNQQSATPNIVSEWIDIQNNPSYSHGSIKRSPMKAIKFYKGYSGRLIQQALERDEVYYTPVRGDRGRDPSTRGQQYVIFSDRPNQGQTPFMKREQGVQMSLQDNFDNIKDEKLFVREGVSYDIDKFRVVIELDGPTIYEENDKDVLNYLILNQHHWGQILSGTIQAWSNNGYLKPEDTLQIGKDTLHYSPIVNNMECICRQPLEVWIDRKHGIEFVATMTRSGWPMCLNPNRYRTKNMIDHDSCKYNPPSIRHVFRALADIEVKIIMLRKQGMRWKTTDSGDPVHQFFTGLDYMRSEIGRYSGEVSLTHIHIAQEWTVPTSFESNAESRNNDVRIPRWTHESSLNTRKNDDVYTCFDTSKTDVEYYPQFTGLTGVKDGGITINNRTCHKSPYTNGLARMTCYLGSVYHTMRERNVKMLNLNSHQSKEMEDWTIRKAQLHCQGLLKDLTKLSSLLLDKEVPFQMRTEMKFRFSYNQKDKNSVLRTHFSLPHFIVVSNDIDAIRESWQVKLSPRPVYLSGICKAVQMNVGQMYREVSRRMSGSMKMLIPGNLFLYFRYLNCNAMCNLGFTGKRVDQWKFQWLTLADSVRPDFDGVAYLYSLQKAQEEEYEKKYGEFMKLPVEIRKKKYPPHGIPQMAKHLLLDQYGIATDAGLDLIFHKIAKKVIKEKKKKDEDIPIEIEKQSYSFFEKQLALTKHFRQQKLRSLKFRDTSMNEVPTHGPIVETREFLDKCDPTNGAGIPKVQGIGIRMHALFLVMSPRLFDKVNSNVAVKNATYSGLMKAVGMSEDMTDSGEVSDYKTAKLLQRELDLDYTIHTPNEIDETGDPLDRAPIKKTDYEKWLQQAPVDYHIHTMESYRELARIILKRNKKAAGKVPLSADTVIFIKKNLNFASDKVMLKRVAMRRLGLKVSSDLSWTHTRLLEEVAAAYKYTFKTRLVQQNGPNDDSLMPEVESMFQGTIIVGGEVHDFYEWIDQDSIPYAIGTDEANYELTRCILQKNCLYGSTHPLSHDTISFLRDNPNFARLRNSLFTTCRKRLGQPIPNKSKKKNEVLVTLAKFYGYDYLREEDSAKTTNNIQSNIDKIVGILNPGNQCYSISVLQMLRCASDFIKTFISKFEAMEEAVSDVSISDDSSLIMSSAFVDLNNVYPKHSRNKAVDIEPFYSARRKRFHISPDNQECASEFLDLLLDDFEKQKEFQYLIETAFQSTIEQDCECTKCGDMKFLFDKEKVRSITFPNMEMNKMTLDQMIEGHSQNWGESQEINCNVCGCRREFITTARTVIVHPHHMIFTLKRFGLNENYESFKRFDEVSIPFEYNINVSQVGHVAYELKAIITHVGNNMHSGHYVCYIQRDLNWICCNDHKVYMVTYDKIKKEVEENGYIIMYSRKV